MDLDKQSVGSIEEPHEGLGVGNIHDDAKSQQPRMKTERKKKHKKDKKREAGDKHATPGNGGLEDIDDAEVIAAYDNPNLNLSQGGYPDNLSQASCSKKSVAGGNGNPNKLPGLGDGPGRQKFQAKNLERTSSVGSASVGRMSHVNYMDRAPDGIMGSGSLILDESHSPSKIPR